MYFQTRMQSLAPSPEASYRNVRDGLMKMITTEGLMRPVKGVNAVIMGAGPAHALYFSAYEGIKKKFGSSNPLLNDFANGEVVLGSASKSENPIELNWKECHMKV